MIITPLVLSCDKGNLQLLLSGEAVCFVISTVVLYLKISGLVLNHFMRKKRKNAKTDKNIGTTSVLPVLNLGFRFVCLLDY